MSIYLVIEQGARHGSTTQYRAFHKKEDAIAYMYELAGEDNADWDQLDEESEFYFPSWKSLDSIHSNTYECDFLIMKEIDLD
tara:strand:- start:920 stop:1165 length:246 start_codon:yes stop_codon:yes gene_type:complete